jgi:putative endonuclease
MLASQRNGTLYIGSTESLRPGFTAKYGVDKLVWFESHDTRGAAFRRERAMKKWNRLWKITLIERFNPSWRHLSTDQ